MSRTFISLSPNTQTDDVLLALQLVFQPWKWRKRKNLESGIWNLEKEFKDYHKFQYAYSFNSGRSALMAILYALGIGEGPSFAKATEGKDEVLIQAFTCNAVPNPVIWTGAKPVYVDIDDTLNMDPEDLERKITLRQAQGKRTKVVMVQHTFGVPANMERILEIARRYNLYVIEDCAHALGAKYKGKLVGTLGDVSFFSFGRDKIISSVYGGMAATNNLEIAKKLEEFRNACEYSSYFWVFQQLAHPILFAVALPFYNVLNIGKILIRVAQKIKLLSFAVAKEEKRGNKPSYFPRRMPEALAALALRQFKKLKQLNEHRREIANFYLENINIKKYNMPDLSSSRDDKSGYKDDNLRIFLRFSLSHPERDRILEEAQKRRMYLGDWYTSVIAPYDTDLSVMHYVSRSCPRAEETAKQIFNLPTHINISLDDAKRIVEFLNKFY